MLGLLFTLGRLAIINSDAKDAEKLRGDTLQQSINEIKSGGDQRTKQLSEEQKFLEYIREYLTAQNESQRQTLINQLRGFQFTSTTTTTTRTTLRSTSSKSTSQTSSTIADQPSSTTTMAKPPQSTTTTTGRGATPTTLICIKNPVHDICH